MFGPQYNLADSIMRSATNKCLSFLTMFKFIQQIAKNVQKRLEILSEPAYDSQFSFMLLILRPDFIEVFFF